MRRLLAAAALGAVVLTAAGCANSGTPAASGTTAAPATSAAPAGGGSTKEICDSLEESGKKFESSVTGLTAGMAGGDPAKAKEALVAAGAGFTEFTAEVRAKAATASDPEFKKALEDVATSLETLGKTLSDLATKDVAEIQKDPTTLLNALSDPKFAKSFEDMSKFCPGLGS
jgi:hypothetical protein